MKVAIAGASGFVGEQLVQSLLNKGHEVVGISRSKHRSEDREGMQWRTCNLFTLSQLTQALRGCDCAFYLVHSMIPSVELAQGHFWDYDLVLADNFARAARANSLKQIIYVGGIVPDDHGLSRHLLSRLEVERALAESGVPLTTLRCGVILGSKGSSFRILYNLVRRLPIMICPSWTKTLSNPIGIEDVISALVYCLGNKSTYDKWYDVGGRTTLSYIEMMKILGDKIGHRPIIFAVPFFSPMLSRRWVSFFGGAPKELAYPLIASLKTHAVTNIHKLLPKTAFKPKNFRTVITNILERKEDLQEIPHAFRFTGKSTRNHEVQSIQRIESLYRFSAKDVAELYFRWLPKFFKGIVFVVQDASRIELKLRFLSTPLMIFEASQENTHSDYQEFNLRGGLLDTDENLGRLVFRTIIDGRFTMIEVHEYVPKLPWYLYRCTQAWIHLLTVRSFNRYVLGLQQNQNVKAYFDDTPILPSKS